MTPPIRSLLRLSMLLFAAGLLASCAAAPPAVLPLDFTDQLHGYSLVWHEEFDAPLLDADIWSYRSDTTPWSKQQSVNTTLEDGHLRIALRREDSAGKQYTGGGIISRRTFRYGYYEAKFKCPAARGWRTSFMTMLQDGSGGIGHENAKQQIDICQQDSADHHQYSAGVIDWSAIDPNRSAHGRESHPTPDLSNSFHTYGCEFTPTRVRFFFDGKLQNAVDVTMFSHNDQHLWLTAIAAPLDLAQGMDNDALPANAIFDWVRFYQIPVTTK